MKMVGLSDGNRARHNVELDVRSRAALIMANVERLAEDASAIDLPAATSAEFVRRIMDARASRRHFFSDELFSDPAWDILLGLYALRCDQRRTSVSKLSLAAAVPATTALRWLEKLHQDGLIERQPDPLDARRVWVTLSDKGFDAMQRYLAGLAAGSIPI